MNDGTGRPAGLEEDTLPPAGARGRPQGRGALPRRPRSATDYAIFTADPQGRVTGWNKGAENLLGWAGAEALGMDGRLTFTPEDRERGVPEAEMAAALAEGRAGNERWHLRKDGSRFWGSGLLVPLRGDHERGFLKVMRDRTARREGDERQRLLLEELAHRVKNSLAVVLAMARQSGERAADVALIALVPELELRDRHGVPSLFVSGQAPDALAARDAALGLVRKPYAPEDVARAVEAVAELLRGRRPARLPPGLELFGGTEP